MIINKRSSVTFDTSNKAVGSRAKYLNMMSWKGIIENHNVYAVDQNSFEDCKNVYVDDEERLASRDPLIEKSLSGEILPSGYNLIDIVNVGEDKIYVSQNVESNEYRIIIINDITYTNEENIIVDMTNYNICTIEHYAICFNDSYEGAKVYDTLDKAKGWQPLSNFIEVPVIKRVTGTVVTDLSSNRNYFTNKYKKEYVWTPGYNVLPEGDTGTVHVISSSKDISYELPDANKLPDYRIIRELDITINTNDIVSIKYSPVNDTNTIAICNSLYALISYTNGEGWTKLIYPEFASNERFITSNLSEDGSTLFIVTTHKVYYYKPDTTWTSIEYEEGVTLDTHSDNYYISKFLNEYIFIIIDTFRYSNSNISYFYIKKASDTKIVRSSVSNTLTYPLIRRLEDKDALNIVLKYNSTSDNLYCLFNLVSSNYNGTGWAPQSPTRNNCMWYIIKYEGDTEPLVEYYDFSSDIYKPISIEIEDSTTNYILASHVTNTTKGTYYEKVIVDDVTTYRPVTLPDNYDGRANYYMTSPTYKLGFLHFQWSLTINYQSYSKVWREYNETRIINGTSEGTESGNFIAQNTVYAPMKLVECYKSKLDLYVGGDIETSIPSNIKINSTETTLTDVSQELVSEDKWYMIINNKIFTNSISLNTDNTKLTAETQFVTFTFEYGTDEPFTEIPNISYSDTELYLAFDKTLRITNNIHDEDDLYFNLPSANDQSFIDKITALKNISTTEVAVFFEDNIYICSKVYDETLSRYRYDYYRTKLSTGVRLGDSVINTLEGSFTVFPTRRGLAALNYQAFMATTDQVITYISDNISDYWTAFYDNSQSTNHPIHIMQWRTRLIITNGSYEMILFDLEKASWWKWEVPVNIRKCLTDQINLGLVSNKLYEFKASDLYYDLPNTPNEQMIEWNMVSQQLHMNAPDNYKNLRQLVFQLYDNNENSETLYTILATIKLYRKKAEVRAPETIKFKIDELRTFVKRFNYWKVNEIQWALSSDAETHTPIKLQLNGISVKYEIGEEVR